MIYFRCDRCAGVIRADEPRAGTEVRCERRARANVCPDDTIARPVAPPVLPAPPPSLIRIAVAVLLLVSLGWAAWSALMHGPAAGVLPPGDPTGSAADRRQEQILKQAVDYAPDPALGRVYDELNVRHFDAFLPPIPVVWEPRLGDVGSLAPDEAFTLEGMFGHIGDKAVILLNPDLSRDPAAVRRTLSHEMVHAWLYMIGDTSTDHGPAFQATLRRLSAEGAFPGIIASEEEREGLAAWLTSESARLDSVSMESQREGEALAREARDIEQALAALDARSALPPRPPGGGIDRSITDWTLRRDAYNRRVTEFRARADRHRADLAAFNAQVERHNLMLSYPDGLDRRGQLANRR